MSDHEATLERLREKAAEKGEEEETSLDEEKASSGSSLREYVVFILTGAETYKIVGRVQAGSAESAIRLLGPKLSNDVEYAAVPSRNWNPVLVSIETTTAFRLTPK